MVAIENKEVASKKKREIFLENILSSRGSVKY